MTLADWGSIGNIFLGIASVFTAVVTAVVLCKQHRLQKEQHKLEQDKLNVQQLEHQPRFQFSYTEKELIITNEGCELSAPIQAQLYSMVTVQTTKFFDNEWKKCICCFPILDFYQTFHSTGNLKGNVAIATFNALAKTIYNEKLSNLRNKLLDTKNVPSHIQSITNVSNVASSIVVQIDYMDMYNIKRVVYFWDSQQISEGQYTQLVSLYKNVPNGKYRIIDISYERIAPLVFDTNIELKLS